MHQTVLITGASGGLGEALARVFAREGYDLILVARREERLKELAEELETAHAVRATPIAMDLSAPDAVRRLHRQLGADQVDILVNNAGFGDLNAYFDTEWERQEQMIDLNVKALAHLCHVFGNEMKARGAGKILNISSLASFGPGPYMAGYFASKAYVQSLSEALAEELRGSGVTVTALCPSPITTDFERAARMENSHMFRVLKPHPAEKVAQAGYRAVLKGKPVCYFGPYTKLLNLLIRLSPRAAVRRTTAWINGKPK